jgi:hypothetical protein
MSQNPAYKLISLLILLSIAVQPVAPVLAQQSPSVSSTVAVPASGMTPGVLFRTIVTVDSPSRRARLEALGVVVLTEDTPTPTLPLPEEGSEGGGRLVVLADADQLEALARLRFEPRASDDLGRLVTSHAVERPWLAASLRPLLAQAEAAAKQAATAAVVLPMALEALHAAMRALTVEQMAALAGLTSVDDDADGLTNTQETWWCTDPLNADSDSDGRSDGTEIQALKDWMANERAAAPNETPWPSWPFNDTTCPDKDHDSIPNLAERWELGLNMDLESSDRDKFDDGQELFGVTYCPGGDLSCGYGDLPRSSDSGYVGAAMPSWVKAPGNHPLVAAFPVPEVDVVESSLHVETVTTVTTDHTIGSGTEKSYSTAKTEGTSTSVANTQTWNEWQEVTDTAFTTELFLAGSSSVIPSTVSQDPETVLGVLELGTTVLSEPVNCIYTELQVLSLIFLDGHHSAGKANKGLRIDN